MAETFRVHFVSRAYYRNPHKQVEAWLTLDLPFAPVPGLDFGFHGRRFPAKYVSYHVEDGSFVVVDGNQHTLARNAEETSEEEYMPFFEEWFAPLHKAGFQIVGEEPPGTPRPPLHLVKQDGPHGRRRALAHRFDAGCFHVLSANRVGDLLRWRAPLPVARSGGGVPWRPLPRVRLEL